MTGRMGPPWHPQRRPFAENRFETKCLKTMISLSASGLCPDAQIRALGASVSSFVYVEHLNLSGK